MRRAAVLMMAPVLWLGIASGAVAGGAPIHFDEKQLAPGDQLAIRALRHRR
jgi:hypothetical protein